MKITTHEMLSHTVQSAKEAGTAYTNLNEGAEKANDEIRKDIRAIGF